MTARKHEDAGEAPESDAMAIAALYERYGGLVRSTVRRMLRDGDESEDVAQGVWANLLARGHTKAEHARPGTWLFAIARNAGIDAIRRRYRAGEILLETATTNDAPAGIPEPLADPRQSDPGLGLLRTRIRDVLNEALAVLRGTHAERAQCFELFYIEQLSVHEIAAELGLAEGTVKSHLYYARRFVTESYPALDDLRHAMMERTRG